VVKQVERLSERISVGSRYMLERQRITSSALSDERCYVVDSTSACRVPAQDFVPTLCSPPYAARVIDAVSIFTTELFQNSDVDAVAFICAHQPRCLTTLVIEVLTRVESGNEAATATIRTVTEAKAALSRQLRPVLPSSLGFVSTARLDVDQLKPTLDGRWRKDHLEPRAFVVFHRS